jgi:hypothetical protein
VEESQAAEHQIDVRMIPRKRVKREFLL